MKKLVFLFLMLISYNAVSQDLVCLDIKLYTSNYDVMEIRDVTSNNVMKYKANPRSHALELVVFTDSLVEFPNKEDFQIERHPYTGYKAILTNSSSNEVSLSNMDGNITVVRQAYYKNKWVNVQSFNRRPKRICGNSYMSTRIIKTDSFLFFVVPCLNGDIKTTFRLLIHQKSSKEIIYSNEFDGFVSRELLE